MNKRLQRLWLFFTNWMELDTFDTEEELDDQLELLHRQNIPTKVVDRTNEKARQSLCSASVPLIGIMPVTAPAGGAEHR